MTKGERQDFARGVMNMPPSWRFRRSWKNLDGAIPAGMDPSELRRLLINAARDEVEAVDDEHYRRLLDPSLAAAIRQQPCAYCGGPGGTVDHVVPIARGGTSVRGNLAPACRPCNSSKGTKRFPVQWDGRSASRALDKGAPV